MTAHKPASAPDALIERLRSRAIDYKLNGRHDTARICNEAADALAARDRRIAALEAQISGLIRMNADDVAAELKETP